MELSRREAMLTFVGLALGKGLRAEEVGWTANKELVTPVKAAEYLGLFPESCSAQDAAQLLCDLRDGIKARKIPCTDWQFSDMLKEICSCVNSYDTQDRKRNTEFIRGLIPSWLDDCLANYRDKGEELPYGEYADHDNSDNQFGGKRLYDVPLDHKGEVHTCHRVALRKYEPQKA